MTTHAARLQPHAEAAVAAANAAEAAAAQVADTYMQGGANGWRAQTEAALFDAAMTLRAAADRLDALRRERATAVALATSYAHAMSSTKR